MDIQPGAPFLEMYLFFGDRLDSDAFYDVLDALLKQGARIGSKGVIFRGDQAKCVKFTSYTNPPENMEFAEIDLNPLILESLRTQISARIVLIDMVTKIFGEDRGMILTYGAISEVASSVDKHPIAIWADGMVFGGYNFTHYDIRQQHRWGEMYFRLLKEIIGSTNPSYAALTVEANIPCPSDMKLAEDPIGFANFYISYSYFSPSEVEELRAIYKNSYVEDLDNGLFVLTSYFFLPEGTAIAEVDIDSRRKVGKMFASKAP